MLVDVSHFNTDRGPINWAAANRSIDGVYMKITEGLSLVDPAWQADYTGAGGQSIPRGPYHFADLGSATAEADHFADQVLLRVWELVPVLDIEKTGATAAWLKAFRARFRARMSAAGRSTRFRVYTSFSFLQGALAPGGWVDAASTIWAARYAATLGFDHPQLVLWQNTSTATLAGFVGSVDEDQYQHGWTPAADTTPKPEAPDVNLTDPLSYTDRDTGTVTKTTVQDALAAAHSLFTQLTKGNGNPGGGPAGWWVTGYLNPDHATLADLSDKLDGLATAVTGLINALADVQAKVDATQPDTLTGQATVTVALNPPSA
jgi:GH25 family lysozyme M1 (1,4-beta-N-acetylmuramidase)